MVLPFSSFLPFGFHAEGRCRLPQARASSLIVLSSVSDSGSGHRLVPVSIVSTSYLPVVSGERSSLPFLESHSFRSDPIPGPRGAWACSLSSFLFRFKLFPSSLWWMPFFRDFCASFVFAFSEAIALKKPHPSLPDHLPRVLFHNGLPERRRLVGFLN